MPGVENLGAIIDCEANSSEICLCRKSHWLTSREIAVGLVHIGNLGCAEILRQWELTRHHVTELSSTEVLKSVYLTTWAKGSSVLTEEMRTTYADLTVCEIDLSKVLSLARGVVWPKVIATENISLACVAGMALSPSLPSIDLVPKRIRLAQQRRLYQRQAIILGVWVLVALMALGSALGVGFFRKNVQLSALEAQYRSAKQEALEVEKQLEQVRDIQDRLKNHLIFTDLAVVLYRLLPSAMYLVNIAVSNDNVLSLEGVSATAAAINQFQKGMVDARYFSNVSLDYVNKRVTQQGEVDYFKITCTLKSNGQS